MRNLTSKLLVPCCWLLLLAACGGDDTTGQATADGSAGTGGMTAAGGTTNTGGGGASSTAGAGGASGANSGGMAGAAMPPTDGAVSDQATSDAATAPLTIASGAGRPTGIALSASAVYWAAEDKDSILTCPKTGCGASAPTLVVSTPAPRGIALRGTTLYWITAGTADGSMSASVKKCTLGACAANQIVDLSPGGGAGGPFGRFAIAVDDQRFYTTGGPVVFTCPVAGCGDAAVGQLGGIFMGPLFGVAVDSTSAYTGRGFGGLDTCPLSGCSSPEDETRIIDTPPTLAIALDATNVYWSEYYLLNSSPDFDGAIRTCPKSGCAIGSAKVLAAGSIEPYAIAVDDANLYYTDYRNGRVERISKTDFGHACVVNHLSACEACAARIKCDGVCSPTCADAGAD